MTVQAATQRSVRRVDFRDFASFTAEGSAPEVRQYTDAFDRFFKGQKGNAKYHWPCSWEVFEAGERLVVRLPLAVFPEFLNEVARIRWQ